jgi:RNA polymerase primary sigma factor
MALKPTEKRYSGLKKLWTGGRKGVSPLALQQSRDFGFLAQVRKDEEVFKGVIARLQAGEPGVERILLGAHYPLLLKIVKRYAGAFQDEVPDMLQSARIAMLEACARFDLENPDSSIGYIWMYVKHYVVRDLVNQSTVVRIPVNQYKSSKDSQGNTVKPSYAVSRRHVLTFTEMEGHTSEENTVAFEEVLVSEEPAPDDLVDLAWRSEVMETLIKRVRLSLRESQILKNRMLGKTLGEVGEIFGMSRERIRQIEAEALDKLRHRAKMEGLARKDSGTPEGEES